MAANSDEDGKVEVTKRTQAVSSVALAVFGGVMAIVQFVQLIQSGEYNLILSAISVLMLIIGVTVLFTMKKRWSALTGAAVTLAILIFAVGAVFFARPPESGSFAIPSNGQHVSGKSLFVAGNVEGVSSTLLCIVKVDSADYFPHATQSADSQWSAVVGIGPQTINRPLPLTLSLATATQAAVDEIRIREQADPDYNRQGLGPNLPPGIKILAEVEIVRTS